MIIFQLIGIIILGRNGLPLYEAEVPQHWKKEQITASSDTTKPIATYRIEDKVHITVHNFPGYALDERIPLEAQIARWQKQFPNADSVSPTTHDGFYGYCLEGKSILAWCMQLDPELFQKAVFLKYPTEVCADYTIKAVGEIISYKEEIVSFAHSLRLHCDIPEKM